MKTNNMRSVWLGTFKQLTDTAESLGAMKGEDGRFVVHGHNPKDFMGHRGGDDPVMVFDDMCVVVNGVDVNMLEALCERQVGMRADMVVLDTASLRQPMQRAGGRGNMTGMDRPDLN